MGLTTLVLLGALAGAGTGWERAAYPASGVELQLPSGWRAEALAGDAVAVTAPPPLRGRVVVLPLSAAKLEAVAAVRELGRRLQAEVASERPVSNGHAALLRFLEPGAAPVQWTALAVAAAAEGRAVVTALAAPSAEFAAARPTLEAIAASVRLSRPTAAAPVVRRPLPFEPFREPAEQAFSLELPSEWTRELSAGVVAGDAAYARASALVRSPDRRQAFAHYKIAAFRAPAEGRPAREGERPYQPGALVLERYLFPEAVRRAGGDFGEWSITRRGGVKPLFEHRSGVRFDGEDVEYQYRFKGELLSGRAYVVTYSPGPGGSIWFLYGLFGWEAPPSGEAEARRVGLRLLTTFQWEGRYATQGDLFWDLARQSALDALEAGGTGPAPTTLAPRPEPEGLLEGAALALPAALGARPGLTALFDARSGPAPRPAIGETAGFR